MAVTTGCSQDAFMILNRALTHDVCLQQFVLVRLRATRQGQLLETLVLQSFMFFFLINGAVTVLETELTLSIFRPFSSNKSCQVCATSLP